MLGEHFWWLGKAGAADAKPIGDDGLCRRVKDVTEPHGSTAGVSSPSRRRDNDDVGTLAWTKTVADSHIGDTLDEMPQVR